MNVEAFRPKLDELCHYSEKGRPHDDVVKMFRILILQTLYDLSDEDMEFNLYDRLSFQKFVGIGVMDELPDARTRGVSQSALQHETLLSSAKIRRTVPCSMNKRGSTPIFVVCEKSSSVATF
ncbi:MAG: transposase, partial [Akkermansia sp.]